MGPSRGEGVPGRVYLTSEGPAAAQRTDEMAPADQKQR